MFLSHHHFFNTRFYHINFLKRQKRFLQLPTNFSIFSLIPNQPYRARIRYITDSDRSQWSSESEWIKTLEMEPIEAPRDLQARPYESSSILLEWQALDPLKWHSDRIGYRILYRIYPSNDSFLVDELPMSDAKVEGGKVQHVIRKLAR